MKPKSEINMVGNTCNQANWVDELFTRYEKCTVILQTAQLINISVLKKSFKQILALSHVFNSNYSINVHEGSTQYLRQSAERHICYFFQRFEKSIK